MAFSYAPSPYSIPPEAFVALSQLNLQNPSQAQGQPVSSFGLTQGTPAVQSNTQAALQQALSNALNGGSSLQGLVQGLLANPQAAQAYGGSTSPAYTPNQPTDAFRINFDGTRSPLFPGGVLATPNPAPTPAPAPAPAPQPVRPADDGSWQFWNSAGGAF
jgi:hypothetical protein